MTTEKRHAGLRLAERSLLARYLFSSFLLRSFCHLGADCAPQGKLARKGRTLEGLVVVEFVARTKRRSIAPWGEEREV